MDTRTRQVANDILAEYGPDTQNPESELFKAASAEFEVIVSDFQNDGIGREDIPLTMHKRAWMLAAMKRQTQDNLVEARETSHRRSALSPTGASRPAGSESGAQLQKMVEAGDVHGAMRAMSDDLLSGAG